MALRPLHQARMRRHQQLPYHHIDTTDLTNYTAEPPWAHLQSFIFEPRQPPKWRLQVRGWPPGTAGAATASLFRLRCRGISVCSHEAGYWHVNGHCASLTLNLSKCMRSAELRAKPRAQPRDIRPDQCKEGQFVSFTCLQIGLRIELTLGRPREAAVAIVNYVNHRNPNVAMLALNVRVTLILI